MSGEGGVSVPSVPLEELLDDLRMEDGDADPDEEEVNEELFDDEIEEL